MTARLVALSSTTNTSNTLVLGNGGAVSSGACAGVAMGHVGVWPVLVVAGVGLPVSMLAVLMTTLAWEADGLAVSTCAVPANSWTDCQPFQEISWLSQTQTKGQRARASCKSGSSR